MREAGIDASVGPVGDGYDDATAGSSIGRSSAEVIHRLGPRRGQDEGEYATLEWVRWYDDERLHGERDHLSPKGFEARYRRTRIESAAAA